MTVMRAVVAALVFAACDEGAGTVEPMTDGTLYVTMSEAVDTNMNLAPFDATEAHGNHGREKSCSGPIGEPCRYWPSLSFNGTQPSGGNVSRSVNIAALASDPQVGSSYSFESDLGYDRFSISDNIIEYMPGPREIRTWDAISGTLTIDAVDGDLIAFTLDNVRVEPGYYGAFGGDPPVGTFRVDGGGEIRITHVDK